MLINNQGNYLNKSETEVELDILFIASPIRLDIGKTSMFLALLTFSTLSIVSVITKFFITELLIFLEFLRNQILVDQLNTILY